LKGKYLIKYFSLLDIDFIPYYCIFFSLYWCVPITWNSVYSFSVYLFSTW